MKIRGIHPITVLRYPVTQSGAYFNGTTNKYEFWFFLNGQTAKVGECNRSESDPVIRTWRRVSIEGLKKLILKRIADGTLSVSEQGKLLADAGA